MKRPIAEMESEGRIERNQFARPIGSDGDGETIQGKAESPSDGFNEGLFATPAGEEGIKPLRFGKILEGLSFNGGKVACDHLPVRMLRIDPFDIHAEFAVPRDGQEREIL